MSNYRINLRYASALYDFAVEKDQVEQTYNDVQLIADITNSSRELRLLLKSPVIFSDKKLKVLHELFKDKIGIVTYTFMSILLKKRREENLHGIANSFIDIYRRHKGIKVAQVTTATPLDSALKNQLISILKNQANAEIILEEIVDPSILGGLIVKIEGVKFDDSIRKKIQSLQQEFNVNTYKKGF